MDEDLQCLWDGTFIRGSFPDCSDPSVRGLKICELGTPRAGMGYPGAEREREMIRGKKSSCASLGWLAKQLQQVPLRARDWPPHRPSTAGILTTARSATTGARPDIINLPSHCITCYLHISTRDSRAQKPQKVVIHRRHRKYLIRIYSRTDNFHPHLAPRNNLLPLCCDI